MMINIYNPINEMHLNINYYFDQNQMIQIDNEYQQYTVDVNVEVFYNT